jgi:branched-chain amino acid transport system substrate-binding protein
MRRRTLLAGAMIVAATRARAAEAIRIGVLTDMNGILANDMGHGSAVAAQLAIEDAGGKVGDRAIELLVGDHQQKPDVGAAIARQWFDSGVCAIFNVPNSAIALGTAELARVRNRVFVAGGASSSELTNTKCSPNTVAWAVDNYAIGHSTGQAVLAQGGKNWFFLTSDYAFGYDLEAQAMDAVRKGGGKVAGSVRVPLGSSDYSSFLLQAQQSGADVLMISAVGDDTVNAVKQTHEFGLNQTMRVAAPSVTTNDVVGIGVAVAQGILKVSNFDWDMNEGARAFARRFAERMGKRTVPTNIQAGDYSAVLHTLKALQTGVDPLDGRAVVARMKQSPVEDAVFGKASIRADGRVMQELYLLRVKAPGQPKGEKDVFEVVASIDPSVAFRPVSESVCPLLVSKG